MDTSDIYIKMCKQVQELQTEWNQKDGDFVYQPKQSILIESDMDYTKWFSETVKLYNLSDKYNDILKLVWLPRQDQLQNMIGNFDDCLSCFYWWSEATRIGDYYGYDSDSFLSFEQLCLAILMMKRYNKVWLTDKEDWTALNNKGGLP